MPKTNNMTNLMNYVSKFTLRANINWLDISISSSNVRTASENKLNVTIIGDENNQTMLRLSHKYTVATVAMYLASVYINTDT